MEPITRQEVYLAAAAGESIQLPEPITREEVYLKRIAENGGGGGGTTNYNNLSNKPQINGHELSGNKSSSDLGIPTKTSDLNNDSNFVADANYVHTDNNYDATSKGIVDGVTSALAGKADSAEIQALTNKLTDEAETRSALGAHNLLENLCTSQTTNGITVVVNADKSITISTDEGGATANTDIIINSTQYFKKGQYILSGCPTGGSDNTYKIRISRGFDESVNDTGSGASLSLANDGASAIYCKIDVKSGTIITTPVTFYPMIRLATDSDPTYQPYAMTNKELTDSKADKSDLASISITGTTNNTGSTIVAGTYFYLNGALIKAKTSIANGATLTANTNYEAVTVGGLNAIKAELGTVESTYISVPSTYSGGSSTNLNFVKRNGICQFYKSGASFKIPTPNTYHNIGTIPAGYRPKVDSLFDFADLNGTTQAMFIKFATDGTVSIYGFNTGTDGTINSNVSGCYILA